MYITTILDRRVESFFIVAAMATFATVWVWLMILVAHCYMRKQMHPQENKNLKFPIPFWPIASIATIGFLVFVIILLGFNDDSRPALYGGATWLVVMSVLYFLFVKKRLVTPQSPANN